jgi:hypothetical protein
VQTLTPGAKLSPRGEFCPLVAKFSVCPSILLNCKEGLPLEVNKGVNISIGDNVHPWGPGVKLRTALCWFHLVKYVLYSITTGWAVNTRKTPSHKGQVMCNIVCIKQLCCKSSMWQKLKINKKNPRIFAHPAHRYIMCWQSWKKRCSEGKNLEIVG